MWLLLWIGCSGDVEVPEDSKAPERDADGDGFGAKADCDDSDAAVNPGVTTDGCDSVDNDCDGEIDEDPSWMYYVDADGDGFGAADSAESACAAPAGMVSNKGDCDDQNPDALPDGRELCDGADNNCDGEVDEDAEDVATWPLDADGDGAGDPVQTVTGCSIPANAADNTWDCDDASPTVPVWVDVRAASGGTGTMDRPYPSISEALVRRAACVGVKPGAYRENLSFTSGEGTLFSTEGSAVTTLEGDGTSAVVTVTRGADLTLQGFGISGGVGTYWLETDYYGTATEHYYSNYNYQRGGGGLCRGQRLHRARPGDSVQRHGHGHKHRDQLASQLLLLLLLR